MKKILRISIMLFVGFIMTGFTNNSDLKEISTDAIRIGSFFQENYTQYEDIERNLGFIDTNGAIRIKAAYSFASNFSEGLAAVVQNGQLCYINAKGELVLKTGLSPSDFVFDGSWYNAENFPIQRFDFFCDRAIKFDPVSKKWGFINRQGKIVIPCTYDYADPFLDGLAVVKKDGKFGVIDTDNHAVIALGNYKMVENLGAGYIAASNDVLYDGYLMKSFSLIDKEGLLIKENISGYVESEVSEGCFVVENDETVIVYDVNGKERFSLPLFENEMDYKTYRMLSSLGPSREGLMVAQYEDADSRTQYGYIDSKTGEEVIAPQYEDAFQFVDGIAIVKKNNCYGAIDSNNMTVIPFQYTEWGYINSFAPIYSSNGTVPLFNEKCVFVKHSSKKQNCIAIPVQTCLNLAGTKCNLDAYDIHGNRYFKLRDLAIAFADTDKKFSVQWDEKENAIMLQSGMPQKGTIQTLHQKESQVAALSQAILYKDDEFVQLESYNINGATYFKLRDIGNLFNFQVTWNHEKKIIEI